MKRLYRIYYSILDNEKHKGLIQMLKEHFKAEVIDHPSRVHPDFRYLELLLEEPGLENQIKDFVRSTLGVLHVKVDWIDTSK